MREERGGSRKEISKGRGSSAVRQVLKPPAPCISLPSRSVPTPPSLSSPLPGREGGVENMGARWGGDEEKKKKKKKKKKKNTATHGWRLSY